jgi:3'(2'), 5'-bisphosphate nucleotidase
MKAAMSDAELAAELAAGAGALLMQLRDEGLLTGSALGNAGDEQAHRFIADVLERHRPEDGLLSEESADDLARLSKERVWILDPLDGTREYSEGRSDWAVHVALAVRGEAQCGAVALPACGSLFRSDIPMAQRGPRGQQLRMVVSRTRPPSGARRLAELLNAELVPMGSCGAKAMAVVNGDADIYLHSGGQHEWDSCAPVAVAQAQGFHCSRIDGNPLRYNQSNVFVPDLLICRVDLSKKILDVLCRA